MPYLAIILFLPWFLLLGSLFYLFPREPRTPRRRNFDLVALLVAFVLSFAGMQWGYALGLADGGTGAIWKQVLATLAAYGAFLIGPPALGFLGDHWGVLRSLSVVSAMIILALLALPAMRQPEGTRS